MAISLADTLFGAGNEFFSFLFDAGWLSVTGRGMILSLAASAIPAATDSSGEHALTGALRWHGCIEEQIAAIDNLLHIIRSHQPVWVMPGNLLAQIAENRDRLLELVNKCRSAATSQVDCEQRDLLLKSTVGLCLLQARIWAYGEFASGVLTVENVHRLGFLLPDETVGHLTPPSSSATAEVKVKIINEDSVRVVIDRSADENSGQITHGWPPGVRNALIVITVAGRKRELYRQYTTHQHNDIRMPKRSRGKRLSVRAALLRHVDDEPRFGNAFVFTMPSNTGELAAAIARQQREDLEEQLREVELHRRETERLRAELNLTGKKSEV